MNGNIERKKEKQCQRYEEYYKYYFIFSPNAIIDPKAMMIKILNTSIACKTMLGLRNFNNFTIRTQRYRIKFS